MFNFGGHFLFFAVIACVLAFTFAEELTEKLPSPTIFPTDSFYYTLYPTEGTPTDSPTIFIPFPTLYPTDLDPIFSPTFMPTTGYPTTRPSSEPTYVPSTSPTNAPTRQPTALPTRSPSAKPTSKPSAMPTVSPTSLPSASPTSKPTAAPTAIPTAVPTALRSVSPTIIPTSVPSELPTLIPSSAPSSVPTFSPSSAPTIPPTNQPSAIPTAKPTAVFSRLPTASPTIRPTRSPTLKPGSLTSPPTGAPTGAPSTHVQLPHFESMTVTSVTRTTITVSAVLSAKKLTSSGTLACLASSQLISSPSISTIINVGSSTFFPNMLEPVSVTLVNLRPTTPYFVYCGIRTSNGFTLVPPASQKPIATTECCIDISYTNAPAYVFGDTSSAYPSASQRNLFTYSYSLSYAPISGSLTVTPVLREVSTGLPIATSVVSVLPASSTFTSTSTRVGSFFFNALATTSGTYSLTLTLSGTAAQFYSPTVSNITISVLNSLRPLAAPTILNALFANNAAGVNIFFSVTTDMAGITTSSFPCNDLFTFAMSGTTTCYWIAADTIFFNVPSTSSLSVNSPITLKSGTNLRAQCLPKTTCSLNAVAVQQTVQLSPPLSPPAPSVVLSVPVQIGSCSNLTIDASGSSGSGGRVFSSVVWSFVDNTGAPIQSVLNYLQGRPINRPISVPNNFLTPQVTYTITLTLTNFLGVSGSASASVFVSVDGAVPILNILGSTSVTTIPYQTTSVGVVASVASCAPNPTLSFSRALYLNNQLVRISSSSNDPRQFVIPPYSLTSGNTYTVQFTATATVTQSGVVSSVTTTAAATITVNKGIVVPSVSGGLTRFVPIDKALVIDASSSYDQDFVASTLSFSWTCSVASRNDFGADCTSLLPTSSASSSVLIVPGYTLSVNSSYNMIVSVIAQDGRSASTTVFVQPTFSGVQVSLATHADIFNPDSAISVSGSISANTTIAAFWSVYFGGNLLSVTPSTPSSLTLTAGEVSTTGGFVFPIAFSPLTFQAGSTYTLRLSASLPGDTSHISFAETSVVINSPPSGGSLIVSPSSGQGISTLFTLSADGWVTSIGNYPLTNEFSYQTSSSSSPLLVGQRSQLTYVVTTLPAGTQSSGYVLTTILRVSDIYSATSQASSTVTVRPTQVASLGAFLSSMVSNALKSGDSSSAVNAINVIASSANAVNCTLALNPYCTSLNRGPCENTPNTCGSCLSNYTGIIGDSNVACVSKSMISSSCTSNAECPYGPCVENTCTIGNKQCPSSTSDICSGHGTCGFTDASGNSLPSCPVSGPGSSKCFATCSCTDNYGSSDCSLAPSQFAQRESLRVQMCQTLLDVSAVQDKSGSLLDTLVSSLSSAFRGNEIKSVEGQMICLQALELVASYASQGYLATAKPTTIQTLIETLSEFINSDVFKNANTTGLTNLASQITDDINNGVLQTVIPGQAPVSVISQFVQVLVQSNRASTYTDATLSPPQTEEDMAAGAAPQGVSLGSDGFASCPSSTGYTKVSITQWLNNPFPGSGDILNPLLKISVFTENPTSSPTASPTTARRNLVDRRDANLSPAPLFFISLQFSAKQDFNFSLDLLSPNRPDVLPKNTTLPECTLYDTASASYIPCHGCNISSYTNTNVTYGCYDASLLCSAAGVSRRLSDFNLEFNRRGLQGDSSDSGGLSSIFGALASTFVAVLSSNPFAISSLGQAIPVIGFVGSLVFVTVVGCLIFLRWDRIDHDYLVYIKKDEKAYENRKKYLEVKKENVQKIKRITSNILKTVTSTGDEETLPKTRSYMSDTVLDDVCFPKHLLLKQTTLGLFLNSVFNRHVYISMFQKPSLRRRRILRWILCIYTILSSIFVDTLFFQTFFNGVAFCTVQRSQSACLLSTNPVTSDTTCKWVVSDDDDSISYLENTGVCKQNDPPTNFTFIVILCLLTLLIALPIQMIVENILLEIVSEIPDLEQWGMNTEYWFGSSTRSLSTAWLLNGKIRQQDLLRRLKSSKNISTLDSYFDQLTASEEREELVRRLQTFLATSKVHGYIPWIDGVDEASVNKRSKLTEFMAAFGINADGTHVPLTLRQRLLYGRPDLRTEARIQAAKEQVKKILDELEEFGHSDPHLRDAFLIQTFLVEQVPNFYKRFCLQKQLFQFDTVSPGKMDPFKWVCCWLAIIGLITFCLYWIFAWAVLNSSPNVLQSWGINFAFSFFQDFIFTQVVKVYVIYVVGALVVQQNVRNTYDVLNEVIRRNFAEEHHDPETIAQILDKDLNKQSSKQLLQRQSSKRYYVPPVTNHHPDELKEDLQDQLRLCQYTSPACRAARAPELHSMDASRLLRHVTDRDIQKCRETHITPIGWVTILIFIPAAFAAVSAIASDKALEVFLPSFLSSYLLFNNTLISATIYGFIGFYVFFGSIMIWKTGALDKFFHNIRLKIDANYRTKYATGTFTPTVKDIYLGDFKTLVHLLIRFGRFLHRSFFVSGGQINLERNLRRWEIMNAIETKNKSKLNKEFAGLLSAMQSPTRNPLATPSFFSSPDLDYSQYDAEAHNKSQLLESLEEATEVSNSIPTLISSLYVKPPDYLRLSKNTEQPTKISSDYDFLTTGPLIVSTCPETSIPAADIRDNSNTEVFEEILRRAMLHLQSIFNFSNIRAAEGIPTYTYSVLMLQHYDELHSIGDYITVIELVYKKYTPYGMLIPEDIQREVIDNFTSWYLTRFPSEKIHSSLPSKIPSIRFSEFARWFHENDCIIRKVMLERSEETTLQFNEDPDSPDIMRFFGLNPPTENPMREGSSSSAKRMLDDIAAESVIYPQQSIESMNESVESDKPIKLPSLSDKSTTPTKSKAKNKASFPRSATITPESNTDLGASPGFRTNSTPGTASEKKGPKSKFYG